MDRRGICQRKMPARNCGYRSSGNQSVETSRKVCKMTRLPRVCKRLLWTPEASDSKATAPCWPLAPHLLLQNLASKAPVRNAHEIRQGIRLLGVVAPEDMLLKLPEDEEREALLGRAGPALLLPLLLLLLLLPELLGEGARSCPGGSMASSLGSYLAVATITLRCCASRLRTCGAQLHYCALSWSLSVLFEDQSISVLSSLELFTLP